MKTKALTLIVGIAIASQASAAIVFATGASSYSENFNSLINTGSAVAWADDSSLPGWYSNRTTITATGGGTTSTNLFSLGDVIGGTDNADRSLGAVASTTTNIQYAVALVNNSGAAISAVNFAFNYEQWRLDSTIVGGATVSYGVFNAGAGSITGSYTAASATLGKALAQGTTGSVNGNDPANRTAINGNITGLTWGAGQELWVRWEYTKTAGGGTNLGIDDLTITAIPEPSISLLGAIGALALLRRRRN